MPIYEYKCIECDTKTNINKSVSDLDREEKCKTCNSALTRVYSSIGISFNGTGFYSTDK